MELGEVGWTTFQVFLNNGPAIINLVHSIVHQLLDHPNAEVQAKALALHTALHAED